MGSQNNNISFGKLGNMSFDKFNGIHKCDIDKNQQSQLDDGIFNVYDKNKDNVLDKGELESLKNDLFSFAGDNGQVGKREARRFIQEKLGLHKDLKYNREDLEAILAQIASGEDSIDSAETDNDGVTTVTYKPNDARITTTQKYTVADGKVDMQEQTDVHADYKLVTTYADDGSSTMTKTYTNQSGVTDTWKYDTDGTTLTEFTRKEGEKTTYYEIKDNNANSNSRPVKTVTNKGSGGIETVEYTYNTDGTITEITTNSATPNEKTVVVKGADGNVISTTTVTNSGSSEVADGVRTEKDAQGNIVTQVPVDANGNPTQYTHKVQQGDTWYGIVQAKYGITDHATTMAVVRKVKAANNYTGNSILANITLPPSIELGNGKTVNLKNISATVDTKHLNPSIASLSNEQRKITIDGKFITPIPNTLSSTEAIAETDGAGYYTVDDSGNIQAYYPTWTAYEAKDEQVWITRDANGNISTYTINTYDASGNPTGGIEYDGQGQFKRRWVNVGFPADNNGKNDGWTHKIFYDADGKFLSSTTNAEWFGTSS